MPFLPREVEDFIGRGITYPIELINGRPKIEGGFKLIESSIKVATAWPLGRRFFLAEFGSRIREILEEPNDDALRAMLTTFFKDAVYEWEPRVEEVDVEFQDLTMTKVVIIVHYRIINSPQPESFIFPFYRNIIT